MVDRLAKDCKLKAMPPKQQAVTPWEEYPVETTITAHLLKADNRKMMIYRACYRAEPGMHLMNDKCNLCAHPPICSWGLAQRAQTPSAKFNYFPQTLKVHHFKWRESSMDKLVERYHNYKRLRLNWFTESERFIDHYNTHKRILAPECENSNS